MEYISMENKQIIMEKRNKIIYYASTGILTALMLFSASMYVLNYEEVKAVFIALSYPSHIIYPLALAKVLGLLAIWTNKSATLKEWAYAGFFFDLLLAAGAHFNANDGEYLPAIVGMVLVLVSYNLNKKLFVK